MSNKVITRFPPSPTGPLHIGNVRTALFNYLYAKKFNGDFIVRVEDTDKLRSEKEHEEDMLDSLEWLGIERDGELWHQSERTEIYKGHLNKLMEEGKAYISHETEGENREVVRFKNPNKKIVFEDLIRGTVEVDTTDLKDFIIARNIHEPVYHLSVVVDDFESGVTHVIRGEDHVSNTPRQILIQEAIGAPRPVYAHLPLILASDKSKLSKRKHGEKVSLKFYRDAGYIPEALINYLALLGWNPGTDQEIFTFEELLLNFDISKVQKGGAIFDEKKLRWVNKEHMKREGTRNKIQEAINSKIKEKFNTDEVHPKITEVVFERIETLGDIDELIEAQELDYFFSEPTIEKEKISWKNIDAAETAENLEKVLEILNSEEDTDKINSEIMSLAERVGKGNVLWPLRYALSGKEKSPDPFTLLSILDRVEAKKRIKQAIDTLR